jgi:hypothetical protein
MWSTRKIYCTVSIFLDKGVFRITSDFAGETSVFQPCRPANVENESKFSVTSRPLHHSRRLFQKSSFGGANSFSPAVGSFPFRSAKKEERRAKECPVNDGILFHCSLTEMLYSKVAVVPENLFQRRTLNRIATTLRSMAYNYLYTDIQH